MVERETRSTDFLKKELGKEVRERISWNVNRATQRIRPVGPKKEVGMFYPR